MLFTRNPTSTRVAGRPPGAYTLPIQQHIASVLSWREVDLVHRRRKTRLAGEGVGHHQGDLFVGKPNRLTIRGESGTCP